MNFTYDLSYYIHTIFRLIFLSEFRVIALKVMQSVNNIMLYTYTPTLID